MFSTNQKLFLARQAYHAIHLFKKNDLVLVKRDGVLWELDLKEGIDLSIYLLGIFEARSVFRYRKIIKSGHTVLDIGANIGAHTLQMAKLVGETGKVYAFEPTDYAFAKLTLNVDLNLDLKERIVLNRNFVADSSCDVPKAVYASWPLAEADTHALHGGTLKTSSPAAVSIDEYVETGNISRVDFIKIDVDGYELPVLRGAQKTLRLHKPYLLFEATPYTLKEQGYTFEALSSLLLSCGYQIDPRISQLAPGFCLNVIASPV